MKNNFWWVAVAVGLLAALVPARGQMLIADAGGGTLVSDQTRVEGLVFFTAQTTIVRSVGFYDAGGDGLTFAHHIGFGSGSGGDVWPFAAATVAAGTGAPLVNGFRWVDLAAPVTLQAGVYYTLAAQVISGADAILRDYDSSAVLNPAIVSFAGGSAQAAGRYSTASWPAEWGTESSSLYNPSQQTSFYFIAANFSTQTAGQLSAVPEPATYAAIFGGVVLVGTAIRRRRQPRTGGANAALTQR